MVRFLATTAFILTIGTSPVWAATVDGKLVSIDAEARTVTLESGAMLNLTEYVVLDGLQPGQLVRVTYTDETIDATAVDILEQAPVEPTDDTMADVTNTDTSDVPTSDVVDPTTDPTTDPAQ